MTEPDRGALESVADELSKAISAIERVDYNAVGEDELRNLLDAHENLRELCLTARRASDDSEAPTGSEDSE